MHIHTHTYIRTRTHIYIYIYLFKSSVCGQTFCINHHFNCDSLGVVYLITCMKYDKQYVGSTVTGLKKRFNNHKSSLIRYGGRDKSKFVVNICIHISIRKGTWGLRIFRSRLLT